VCACLFRFKNLDTMLQGNARCEGRAEAARRDRESKARAQEDGTMEGLYRQHKQAMYESKTAEEDARIAAFLQKQQQDLERDERLVQRVRQDSDELRQLQEKLNMAEVCASQGPRLGRLGDFAIPLLNSGALLSALSGSRSRKHTHHMSLWVTSCSSSRRGWRAWKDGVGRCPSAALTHSADGASR